MTEIIDMTVTLLSFTCKEAGQIVKTSEGS